MAFTCKTFGVINHFRNNYCHVLSEEKLNSWASETSSYQGKYRQTSIKSEWRQTATNILQRCLQM